MSVTVSLADRKCLLYLPPPYLNSKLQNFCATNLLQTAYTIFQMSFFVRHYFLFLRKHTIPFYVVIFFSNSFHLNVSVVVITNDVHHYSISCRYWHTRRGKNTYFALFPCLDIYIPKSLITSQFL